MSDMRSSLKATYADRVQGHGLYWGTYNAVRADFDQAQLRSPRRDVKDGQATCASTVSPAREPGQCNSSENRPTLPAPSPPSLALPASGAGDRNRPWCGIPRPAQRPRAPRTVHRRSRRRRATNPPSGLPSASGLQRSEQGGPTDQRERAAG